MTDNVPLVFSEFTRFLSEHRSLIDSPDQLEFVKISKDVHSYSATPSTQGGLLIRLQAPSKRHWCVRCGLLNWDSIFNRFTSKWSGLPRDEILAFRFTPTILRSYGLNVTARNFQNFRHSLLCQYLAEGEIPDTWNPASINWQKAYQWLMPWFYEQENMHYYFILTDLLFVRMPHHQLGSSSIVVELLANECDESIFIQQTTELNLAKAIPLANEGEEMLLAVPWSATGKEWTSSSVHKYCRRTFKWFSRRSLSPSFSQQCPASVVMFEHHTHPFVRVRSSNWGDIDVFWLAALPPIGDWYHVDLNQFFCNQ